MDNDGFDEILVGAPSQSSAGYSYNGAALMFKGSGSGLGSTPSWTAYGASSYRNFGKAVAAGDVNGDGYSDLIVGAPEPYWSVAGTVYTYHGSSSWGG